MKKERHHVEVLYSHSYSSCEVVVGGTPEPPPFSSRTDSYSSVSDVSLPGSCRGCSARGQGERRSNPAQAGLCGQGRRATALPEEKAWAGGGVHAVTHTQAGAQPHAQPRVASPLLGQERRCRWREVIKVAGRPRLPAPAPG